jgi:site-specific recombinase XerD
MKIRDAVEQFLDHQISSGKFSRETVAKYRRELRRLADFLESAGVYTLNDISAALMMRFFTYRSNEIANSTFVRNISIFKNFWGFFYEKGEARPCFFPLFIPILPAFLSRIN